MMCAWLHLQVLPVQTRIFNSATEMTPSVRGHFLQTPPNLASGSGVNLSTMLSHLGVNPALAEQPEQAKTRRSCESGRARS
jgi:hypothetical protein